MPLQTPDMNVQATPLELQQFKQREDEFNRYIQNMEPIIMRLDNWLENVRYERQIGPDGKKKEVAVSLGPPRMNSDGREFVKTAFRAMCNHNIYLAEFSDKDIPAFYKAKVFGLWSNLLNRVDEYETDDKTISEVFHFLCDNILAALKKSRRDKPSIYGPNQPEMAQQQQVNPLVGLFPGRQY